MKKKNVQDFTQKPDFKIYWQGYEAIRPELLETFDYEFPGRRNVVTITTDEFTAVCPWSGLPDFGMIKVMYVPHKKIIELRSFKYYLYTYRTVGIFQEHLTRRILEDLVHSCDPLEMTVLTDYNIRGGMHTTSEASYHKNRKAGRR